MSQEILNYESETLTKENQKERQILKNSSDVIDCLRQRYPANAYAFLTEVGNSTGFRCNRHADAIVMSLWPSRGLEIIGIEVKVNRSDWVKELNTPEKAEIIFQKCDTWFLAVGDELIVKEGELPRGWGLMVPAKKGGLRVKVTATPKNPEPEPDRSFLAALLRQVCAQATDAAIMEEEFKRGRREGIRIEKERTDNIAGDWKAALDNLRKRVSTFEKASGVSIGDSWSQPEKIGHAVYRVLHGLDGKVKQELEHLHGQALRIAGHIEDELAKDLL